MIPSDLFIRGRQFFGFLIPGMMWVISILLLMGERPLAFIEGGSSLIRAAYLIGISYILGFILQTLIFPVVADRMKKYMEKHPPKKMAKMEELKKQIVRIFKSRLPAGEKDKWAVPHKDLRTFCKLYVLEHSPALGRLLLEKEDDINFMVAYLLSGPTLLLSWLYSRQHSWTTLVIATVLAAAFAYALGRRLYYYLQAEIVYAYEACLMLQLGQADQIPRESPVQKTSGEDGGDSKLLSPARIQSTDDGRVGAAESVK